MEIKNANPIPEEGISSSHETQQKPKMIIGYKAEKLTDQEKRELQTHETTIEKGVSAYWEIGEALIKINNDRLYKEKYYTFQEYCVKRWSFGRSYAHRIMQAAKTYSTLLTIGNKDVVLPSCESQIRPLVKLKPHQVKVVWNNVVTAGEKPVTAAIVEAEVAKLKTPKEPKHQLAIEEEPEVASNATKNGDEAKQDEAFMNMDAAFRDLKKVKGLNDEQKNHWTLLLKDIVEALNKLGVTME
jgi:hypothetical protein